VTFFPPHINVIFMGSPAIGKSSLSRRITKNTFNQEYDVTLGVSFNRFIYKEKEVLEFQLFDCSGNERFSALAQRLVKFMNIGVICYDITNQSSVSVMKTLWEEYRMKRGLVLCLLGLKSDLAHKRQVDTEDILTYSQNENVPFCGEVSSLSGDKVNDFIRQLGELYQKNKDYLTLT